jgi:glucose/mannose-6-phosphate isomerase
VGWAGGNSSHASIFLRTNHDYGRNQTRMDISREIISRNTDLVFDIWAKQNTFFAEALYLIHWGDWLSYYLHEIHQVDIMDIVVIDYLKNELSKI